MKCLLFKVDAGIKYLQIETEVKDDPNTRQIAWHLTPDHGVDNWQVGRVSVKRGQPYKIVITTQRSNAALGYVAIDDFEFIYGTEDCSIMPELARPTTTTTTTTTFLGCDSIELNLVFMYLRNHIWQLKHVISHSSTKRLNICNLIIRAPNTI